jgi:hypothetical protein
MASNTGLSESISRFVNARPDRFPAPAGGDNGIPLPAELELARAFRDSPPRLRADFGSAETPFKRRDAHTLVVFAVRMAIHSVRVNDPGILIDCANALVVDNDLADYRDILVALSIIDECARRVGLDGTVIFDTVANVATAERRDLIRKGYINRTPGMKAAITDWKLAEKDGILTLVRD